MSTTSTPARSNSIQTETNSLRELAARLVAIHLPLAVSNHSFIINDISPVTKLNVDTELVASIIGQLIYTTTLHAPNSCIRITDAADGVILSVHLTHSSTANAYSIAHSLQRAQEMAMQVNGYVGISNQGLQHTTVIFSFANI